MAMDEKGYGYTAANAAPTSGDVTIESLQSHMEKLQQAFMVDRQFESRMFRAMANPMILIPPELERDIERAVRIRVLPMCDYDLLCPIRYTVLTMPACDWSPEPVKHPERPNPFSPTPWRVHEVITLLAVGVVILVLLSKAIQ